MRMTGSASGVEVQGPATARSGEILHDSALELVAGLHRLVREERHDVLDARRRLQRALDAGETPDFLESTRGVREAQWRVT